MANKRSTRNSNNTSINTDKNITSSNAGSIKGSSSVNEAEGKGGKQKNNPYYTWW